MSAVSMAQSFLIRFAETLRDWIISELQSPQMEGDVASLCDPNFDPGMDLRDEQWMNGSPPGYRYLLLLKKAARYYKLSDQPLPEESENLLNRYGYTGKTFVVPSMFWSTRTAFQTAARNLAAVSANQDLGVRQTYSEICIITMKIRCLLRSKKRVVGWVKLDEGDTKDAPERNRLLRLATRGLSEYDCAAYLHKGASTHEHTLDAQGKHPHVSLPRGYGLEADNRATVTQWFSRPGVPVQSATLWAVRRMSIEGISLAASITGIVGNQDTSSALTQALTLPGNKQAAAPLGFARFASQSVSGFAICHSRPEVQRQTSKRGFAQYASQSGCASAFPRSGKRQRAALHGFGRYISKPSVFKQSSSQPVFVHWKRTPFDDAAGRVTRGRSKCSKQKESLLRTTLHRRAEGFLQSMFPAD